MWIENMKMAIAALKANKMRSFLTMLGIIIGIGSVIAITSIGSTMRRMFMDLYKDIGVTQGYISIGDWVENPRQSDYFTPDDFERYKEVFGGRLAYVDADASVSGEIRTRLKKKKVNFFGVDYHYIEVQPMDMLYGRYLNEGDVLGRKPNCVIEASTAKELYGTKNAIGKTFRVPILGEVLEFNIVGVYEKLLSPVQEMMLTSSDPSGVAYIPWTLLTRPNDQIYACHFFANPEMTAQELEAFNREFTAYIARQKNRIPGDFYLLSAQSQMDQMDSMLSGVSAAVGGIAAISLLVGGIGIMNIMLVSVTERTREIGTRKALGATTRDILIQFLTESAALSACGGVIGVALSVGLVSAGGTAFSLPVEVKPSVILMAVGFSALVGIFFGLYPAKKAAERDPIIALRYE